MALQKLNGEQIIDGFHTYVDDDTELSSAEELVLLNKKLNELANDRGWEWTKESFSQAVIFGSNTEIDLPDNFRYFVEDENDGQGSFFTIGGQYNKYPIRPFSQRREGQAYLDMKRRKLVLPSTFVNGTLAFDYYAQPEDIELDTYPPFGGRFHPILYHMMALDFEIIERSDKARSYRQQNEEAVATYKEDMALEDAELKDFNNE